MASHNADSGRHPEPVDTKSFSVDRPPNADSETYVRCVVHGRWMERTAKDCGFNQPFKATECMTRAEYEASHNGRLRAPDVE